MVESINLKLEEGFLKRIDSSVHHYDYSTRTEFIREAIREKLSALEKKELIKKLVALKGSMKGKARVSDEEAGKIAALKIAEKFGIKLD